MRAHAPPSRWSGALAALAAAAMLAGCAPEVREVDLRVAISPRYALTGGNAIDRYRVSFRRRDGTTGRWVRATCDRYFARPGASASGTVPASDGCDAAPVEPAPAGPHVLRPGAGARFDDPVLVVVQGGAADATGAFVRVGLPAVAQFVFPRGRGALTLSIDPGCALVDPAADRAASPYETCEVQGPDGCPTLVPICVAFGPSGDAARVACDDSPANCESDDAGLDGGCAPCAVDTAHAPDGAPATIAAGQQVAYTDCAGPGGEGQFETCGAGGRWSRCLEASPCQGAAAGAPCCVADAPSPSCADIARVAPCAGGTVCDATSATCLGCGARGTPCCAGDTCSPPLECDPGHHTCGCGSAPNAPCCPSGDCLNQATPITCDTSMMPAVCVLCGGDGQRCCPGQAPCATGFACTPGTVHTCRACGGAGQLCCDGTSCMPGSTCIPFGDAGVMACASCGRVGGLCCMGGACAGGAVCQAGLCVACGEQGQPCCANSGCTGTESNGQLVCHGGLCVHCGGHAGSSDVEPCCPTGLCQGTRTCNGSNLCV